MTAARLVTTTSSTVFALVDCNNFFVSCERVFRPDLENKPVIVLSSNDGCAVARSNEAKALGIPMGAPAFKYRDIIRKHDVQTFSANFELYGDISQRLTALLMRVTPRIEVYSVDESFLDLTALDIPDLATWGQELRAKILREIGVPVSIGIAPTKTLAKLAAERAKHDASLAGACNLVHIPLAEHQIVLTHTPVADIWGVGWRLTPKLKAEGIHTAEDLRLMRPQRARQLMGKHGAQMVAELNGLSCLPLEREHAPHKTIMRGRTLGHEVTDLITLESAVATLAARAAYCLRQDGQLVKTASLILNTNRHKPGYQRAGDTVRFAMPTADTGVIGSALSAILDRLHRPQMRVYRVNILFHELVAASTMPLDLFGEVVPGDHDRQQARLAAVDALNKRFGKGHVRYAAEDLSHAWQPRKGSSSPRYTTEWAELPVAKVQ